MGKNLADVQNLATEINKYVQSYDSQENIPAIEVDILLQKTRELYDSLMNIKQPATVVATEVSAVEEKQPEQTPVESPSDDILFVVETPQPEETKEEIVEVPKAEATPTEEAKPKQELFTPKQVTDLSSKLGGKPISEIMSAIGLNDRIRYRAVLFNKDQELFVKTVGVLNDLKTFDDAVAYLQKEFSWDFENADVQEFMKLVARRYL